VSNSRLNDASRFFAALAVLAGLWLVSLLFYSHMAPTFIHPFPAVVFWILFSLIASIPFVVAWGLWKSLPFAWYLGAFYLLVLFACGLRLSTDSAFGIVIFVISSFGLVLFFKDDLAMLRLLRHDA